MSNILIAGMGFVGREVKKLFPDAEEHDPPQGKIATGEYDFAFINVPTPMSQDGKCNIEAVEEVVAKIDAGTFVIRSTIPPGTTDYLEKEYGVDCVMTPEYVASSSPYPPPLGDITKRAFHVLGGRPKVVKRVRRLYETLYPPMTRFVEMSALEAEVTKYMENFYIATYVSFCNQFFDICQLYGIDYDKVKEGFLADPRMTPYWTNVYPEKRGWGGHCLPKDASAIIKACEDKGFIPEFLKGVVSYNDKLRKGTS